MRILVTGGSGFIGSHLCRKLLSNGHEVFVYDNFSTGKIENLSTFTDSPKLQIIEGSILDLEKCKKLVSESEYIFHLAASVGVFNIINQPIESLKINIRGTENMLESADLYNVPFFLASSSEVYGKNISDSLGESDDRIIGSPSKMRWTYSEAKALDESLTQAYFIHNKLETRIVRFFNTVGPRQIGDYGMVIPRFIENALQNRPLQIYGDGTQKRCFLHIQDAIDAVVRVAFSPKTIGTTLNIGNDTEISILELAKKIISLTNSKSPIEFIPYKLAYGLGFEEMQRRVPNIRLINELVEWSPKLDLTSVITDIVKEFESSKGL
jgi:UDP-glucose 4-epimerase